MLVILGGDVLLDGGRERDIVGAAEGQGKDIASSVNMLANEAMKHYCETDEDMLN
jgi:hypothetical protein